MKPILFSLGLFIPCVLGARYYFVCQSLQWCDRTEVFADDGQTALLIDLPDGQAVSVSLGQYAEGSVALTRGAGYFQALDSLAALAKRFPNYSLEVQGPRVADEASTQHEGYHDIGLARAAALSRELQRRGIPADRLELGSKMVKESEGLLLGIQLVPTAPAFERNQLPDPEVLLDSTALLGLRFETNSTALTPNSELTSYAYDLIAALEAAPQRHLRLIGHTDNRAERVFNDSLGYWRAEAVARYLAQLGYPRDIRIETRGEREPIADNTTAEGRYLNRRVEVRID